MAVNVESVIGGAENRAQTMSNQATTQLNQVLNGLVSVTMPAITPVTLDAMKSPQLPGVPTLSDIQVPVLPALGPAPAIVDIPDSIASINIPSPPSSGIPSITEPTRPSAMRSFTANMPQVNIATALPSPPAAFSVSAPSVTPVSLPGRPNINRPSFTSVQPTLSATAPDARTAMEASYRAASPLMIRTLEAELDVQLAKINPQYAAQLAAIEAQLQKYMDGGTGLNPAVENAIYERSKAKVNAETLRVQGDALKAAARRGFTLPDGALMSAVQQARQAGADNNAAASREITVMRAEMEQKNLQFAVNMSADLRKTAINAALSYHQNLVSINGQAVQYSQAVVSALVQAFDAEVKAFTAKLDGYRADVAVFEALIGASKTDIELYKAQIDGEMSKVQVDNARVQAYKAQVEAHGAAVDAYGKNIDAIVQLANVERLKLDVFRASVDAYSAEVQGKTAEWQAYSAAWNGEEAKIKAYLSESQIYAAQVEGYRAQVQAESARIQALAETNRSTLGSYTAEVQAFGAQAQANANIVQAQIASNGSLINAYQVNSQAALAVVTQEVEQFKAKAQVKLEEARNRLTSNIEEAKINVSLSEANKRLAISAAEVYAGMASSALAGVNGLAVAVLEAQ